MPDVASIKQFMRKNRELLDNVPSDHVEQYLEPCREILDAYSKKVSTAGAGLNLTMSGKDSHPVLRDSRSPEGDNTSDAWNAGIKSIPKHEKAISIEVSNIVFHYSKMGQELLDSLVNDIERKLDAVLHFFEQAFTTEPQFSFVCCFLDIKVEVPNFKDKEKKFKYPDSLSKKIQLILKLLAPHCAILYFCDSKQYFREKPNRERFADLWKENVSNGTAAMSAPDFICYPNYMLNNSTDNGNHVPASLGDLNMVRSQHKGSASTSDNKNLTDIEKDLIKYKSLMIAAFAKEPDIAGMQSLIDKQKEFRSRSGWTSLFSKLKSTLQDSPSVWRACIKG